MDAQGPVGRTGRADGQIAGELEAAVDLEAVVHVLPEDLAIAGGAAEEEPGGAGGAGIVQAQAGLKDRHGTEEPGAGDGFRGGALEVNLAVAQVRAERGVAAEVERNGEGAVE